MTAKTELSPLLSGNVAHLIAAQAAEIEALRAEVEQLNRILGRIVEGDGDSTVAIRAGTDAFAAAREYLLRDREEGHEISGYTCTVPDNCETLHWRGQILSMNELVSVAQPVEGEEIMVKEREQRDEALLRQALEALLGQRGEPDWHTGKQRENAIAALRERLGEGAEP